MPSPHWIGFACPVILFVSVLLHELGHVVATKRMGGIADEIVLSPLGGLSSYRVPYEPHSELVAVMSGTLVSVGICLTSAVTLLVTGVDTAILGELTGITISYFDGGHELDTHGLLLLTFWLNWSLILVNFLPAPPFDGGRAVQIVLGFLWPELDTRQSLVAVCRLGRVVAVLLLVGAWYTANGETSTAEPPAWFALSLLSIYVFFCARREEWRGAESETEDDRVFGYDFSQGYTSLERSLPESEAKRPEPATPIVSPVRIFKAWLAKRQAERAQRLREQEQDDERRVDEVLGRLHSGGMDSLSADDRALLDRVSKRYRSRPM